MDQLDEIIKTISLTMGAAWASGINLYATILVLGFMGVTDNIALPPGLEILTDPMVLAAAGLMYAVEFFADKMPGVDTGWDTLHTFVRIPAGVMLAAGAVGDVNPAVTLAAAILGGGMAAGSHFTKAGTRVLINASPEPVTNWTASVLEDITVIAGVWAAIQHPVLFLVLLALFILLLIWLLPKLWAGIKRLFRWIKNMFGKGEQPEDNPAPAPGREQDS